MTSRRWCKFCLSGSLTRAGSGIGGDGARGGVNEILKDEKGFEIGDFGGEMSSNSPELSDPEIGTLKSSHPKSGGESGRVRRGGGAESWERKKGERERRRKSALASNMARDGEDSAVRESSQKCLTGG